MGIGVWVQAVYPAAAVLFIGSNLDIMYSTACKMRIQEEGIGDWQIKGDFRMGMLENTPLFTGGITNPCFDVVERVRLKRPPAYWG